MDPVTILLLLGAGVWFFKKSKTGAGGSLPAGGGFDERYRPPVGGETPDRGRVITPVTIGTIDSAIPWAEQILNPELVALYNETIPGGDITGPGNEFGVASVILSAVNYGLAPNSPTPGNTATRKTAGLPALGATRLQAIKAQVIGIMEQLQKG